MPYERKGKCVYIKGTNEKVGCSDSIEKAKEYLKALYTHAVDENLDKEIKEYLNGARREEYLSEAQRDAKLLTNIDKQKLINLKYPDSHPQKGEHVHQPLPNEGPGEFHNRMFSMAKDEPGYYAKELVEYIGSLDDLHFPRDGRKSFVEWLANAIYEQETEEGPRGGSGEFSDLPLYNNDIRYIVDYLNSLGQEANWRSLKNNSWVNMFEAADEWHDTLKDFPGTGDYTTKEVVHQFENGFTIVRVPSEDLEVEGSAGKMGHCVGGYCDKVEAGEMIVFSLRDRKNEPHATIEVLLSGDHTYSPPMESTIGQIKGKGNAPPVEKYRPMIKAWLETTDYDYKDSEDYLDLLSTEEIVVLMKAGDLDPIRIHNFIRWSRDPALIDWAMKEFEKPTENQGELQARRGMFGALIQNPKISEDQALYLFEKNLEDGRMTDGIGVLFRYQHPNIGEDVRREFNTNSFHKKAWNIVKNRINQGKVDRYLMHSMVALVENSQSEEWPREMIEVMLAPRKMSDGRVISSFLDFTGIPRSTDASIAQTHRNEKQKLFSKVIQGYLSRTYDHDTNLVKRIYEFNDEEWNWPAGYAQIFVPIAASSGISNDIAKDILEKHGDTASGQDVQTNLLLNKSVDESIKHEVLDLALKLDEAVGGFGNGVSDLGERMLERQGILSQEILLRAFDDGFFDRSISRAAELDFYKKHDFYPKKGVDKEWPEFFDARKKKLGVEIVNTKRQQDLHGVQPELPPWLSDINEEVNKYFVSNGSDENFDNHEMATVENLLDPDKPAPWD